LKSARGVGLAAAVIGLDSLKNASSVERGTRFKDQLEAVSQSPPMVALFHVLRAGTTLVSSISMRSGRRGVFPDLGFLERSCRTSWVNLITESCRLGSVGNGELGRLPRRERSNQLPRSIAQRTTSSAAAIPCRLSSSLAAEATDQPSLSSRSEAKTC
jgi:hypothetical protein